MIKSIKYATVRVRNPYFLQCLICGNEISSNDPKSLLETADTNGWKYDYDNDLVICPHCVIHEYYDRNTVPN